ncbi:receptor-like protein EIX2 [Salvia hispanica]|uniref:receptor-like protein EIX2 n=1 Tax=Salvia hispanica TaxID=49212 RepID=UPI002009093B|nr:receptor-like protein EIX2 [Salvia hispanica]
MISDQGIAIKFVLVILLYVFVSGDEEVRCIERERDALLSFKNGLIDAEFDDLSSWQNNECCAWNGVECSNATGHVIALKVNGVVVKDSGKMAYSLLELHHLKYLDLSVNDFGCIPIPESIGSMKQLQHLTIEESNLCGSVPPQLGNLTNLRILDLSHNFLSSISSFTLGSVLESLEVLKLSYNKLNGSIPDLKAFPSLKELHLGKNNFTGSIPLSIGHLSKLQLLYLSFNSLEGLVPLSIGQLSELQDLDLSYNSLAGVISESHFIKLIKLKSLDLSFNPLLILEIAPDWSPPFCCLSSLYLTRCNVGPYFPKWIRSQTNLSILDLRDAKIRDEVPRWLWSTSNLLKSLYLSDNLISGTIPNLSSTSILSMDVSYNQFSGPIPLFPANATDILLSGNMFSGSISSICQTIHGHLEYIDLSNNLLAGDVPNCWKNIPNLHSLNLANNSFSGEIPASLGTLHNLGALQMHGNELCGELPYTLRLCQALQMIDVGGNKLTGEIPTWIGQLYKLQILNLRGNKLHGEIPLQICNLTSIKVLDMSINNLSSIIPDCFNSFTVLASKDSTFFDLFLFDPIYIINEKKHNGYSSFQWKGKESEFWDNLALLKLIDFSSNRLTGNIPKSFCTLRGLISLNLSRNSLKGYIILDIGNMEVLDSLDLSHNQLYGKIPTSLAEIHNLGFLDLSNNNFSGKIPTSTQLQSFNVSSYAENDGLCGDPLPKCPGDSLRPSTPNPEENMNEKDGINFSFMQEVGISMAFGFIFGFWGVIGSFIWKKSWRIAFFNLLDAAGDWFYVRIVVFVSKWR